MYYRTRSVFKGNRKEQRETIKDATHLRYEDQDMDVYYKKFNDEFYEFQIFIGKTAKPRVHHHVKHLHNVESEIEERLNIETSRIKNKMIRKENKKQRLEKLKNALVPGATVRCSFSYNMTFNKFYKVISNKGNAYILEILETEWVDGDIGWTGNVKAGNETVKMIQGKLTAKGLKIDRLYGDVINTSDTFYENHLD